MDTMRKFRWFWAWDDEKEEAWLREMSGQGWHFKAVELPGFYHFEQGNPVDFVYRLDYITERDDKANYLQLFADAGWEFLGEMGGWQYFRQEAAPGKQLAIYTDSASKVQKYRRIIATLLILVPVFLAGVVASSVGAIHEMIAVLMGLILLVFAYAIVRLWLRIGQLRARI